MAFSPVSWIDRKLRTIHSRRRSNRERLFLARRRQLEREEAGVFQEACERSRAIQPLQSLSAARPINDNTPDYNNADGFEINERNANTLGDVPPPYTEFSSDRPPGYNTSILIEAKIQLLAQIKERQLELNNHIHEVAQRAMTKKLRGLNTKEDQAEVVQIEQQIEQINEDYKKLQRELQELQNSIWQQEDNNDN